MSDKTLVVEDLRTHFLTRSGVVRAVDGVSFEVKPGEVLGLVGESGCGKTVTGFSILGLVDPPGRVVGGRVLLDGKDLLRLEEKELRRIRGAQVAMVFQDPMMTLNPVLRIDTQMVEAVRAHQEVDNEEAFQLAKAALQRVGIASPEERLRSYPHQFSGGMRQRVAIALALAAEPKLIVADEPTNALDVSIQAQIINLLEELQAEFRLTYLFVAHDLSVVRHISDRVAVMYLGRIVEITDRKSLYEDPQHPYTKALLSAVPIPDPAVEAGREHVVLGGEVPSPLNPPAGCVFHPRCPIAVAECRTVVPELREVRPGHQAACIRL